MLFKAKSSVCLLYKLTYTTFLLSIIRLECIAQKLQYYFESVKGKYNHENFSDNKWCLI